MSDERAIGARLEIRPHTLRSMAVFVVRASPNRAGGLMVIACLAFGACGENGSSVSNVSDSILPTEASMSRPTLATLAVVEGCATVTMADGTPWGESCLPPPASRSPDAVISETIDGAELALIRVHDGVEMVGSEPPTVRMDHADGWILIESLGPDFTFTLRNGGAEVVCKYNPFFIDCEPATAAP